MKTPSNVSCDLFSYVQMAYRLNSSVRQVVYNMLVPNYSIGSVHGVFTLLLEGTVGQCNTRNRCTGKVAFFATMKTQTQLHSYLQKTLVRSQA